MWQSMVIVINPFIPQDAKKKTKYYFVDLPRENERAIMGAAPGSEVNLSCRRPTKPRSMLLRISN
jgi:hypothetical protein